MEISVIIPCYNEERHVGQCLDALLAQTFPADRYEIILVDNLSTDRSWEVARNYPSVIALRESRISSSYAARNTGTRVARGRILAFTDADCAVAPDWLERVYAAMADESTAVVLGSRRFARETFLLKGMADYEVEKARYVFAQDDPSLYYAYTNNLAVRRDVFERCGPFNEIVRGGDVIFVGRVIEADGCKAVRLVPEMLVQHLQINRWYSWHRKMWIYGRSYHHYSVLSRTRPLSYRNRFQILRGTVKRNGYSPLGTIVLFLSGVAATLAFEAGRWKERRRTKWSPGISLKDR